MNRLVPLFLLLPLHAPSLPAGEVHPFPDVYFHYHLDLSRGLLVLSHETRWTDLVAVQVCQAMDTDGDGATSAAEAAAFVRSWTESVRGRFKVTIQGREILLPEPADLDETLTYFAEKGKEALEVAEWEIDLDFEIPLRAGEGPFRLVLEEGAYTEKDGGDTYWLTSSLGVEGDRGLRILSATRPEDPMYMTRRYEVEWDWKGKGEAVFVTGQVKDLNAEARQKMSGLLKRLGENAWYFPLALLLAIFYGMGHALAPGHGKAMVAGYLVGSKGTVGDAVLLGLVVTITHTFMVFVLSFLWLLFQDRMNTKAAETWLGVGSGVSIALLGIWLFWRRFPRKGRSLFPGGSRVPGEAHFHAPGHHHSHSHPHESPFPGHSPEEPSHHGHTHEVESHLCHDHPHGGEHVHQHVPEHDHHHEHGDPHVHVHDHGHTHTHHGDRQRLGTLGHWLAHLKGAEHSHLPADPDRVTLAQLLGLGISGGIVPCPAALLVFLLALQTGRWGWGFLIVLAFSIGLAGVLVGLGVLMVTSRRLLDRVSGAGEKLAPILAWLPPVSALFVTAVGLYFAWQSWTLGSPLGG